jgi:SAM-dependent methyltransferase
METYEETLARQSANSQVGACKTYYSWLYSLMSLSMNPRENYLEVGAGAGISRYFLASFNVLRTDFLPWGEGEILGGIDAQNLPYSDGEFSGVLGMDMIHHVSKPAKLLDEVIRITKPGGQLIFIEPYVSILSYPVYKIFHPERVTVPFRFDQNKSWVSEAASDGDQGVAQRLFCTKSGRKYIQDSYGDALKVEVDYLSPFAFYLTGGLNRPLRLSSSFVTRFMQLDNLLPRTFRKFTASRMVVRIHLIS